MKTEARLMVERAAKLAKSSSVKAWLTLDERGSWEQTASELLESSSGKASELGLSPEEHKEETSKRLVYLALQAMIAQAKKKR